MGSMGGMGMSPDCNAPSESVWRYVLKVVAQGLSAFGFLQTVKQILVSSYEVAVSEENEGLFDFTFLDTCTTG